MNDRKRLIRPITIMKVKAYLNAICLKIAANEECSLDLMAREHSISGSNATSIVRLGIVKQTDVKHKYELGDNFGDGEKTAKMVIEDVRKHNLKSSIKGNFDKAGNIIPDISIQIDRNSPNSLLQEKDDTMVGQLNEGFKTKQIGSMLERALRQVAQSSQTTIFDNQNNNYRDLVQIASAIAVGVYGVDLGEKVSLYDLYEDHNNFIVIAAKDLLLKLKA